MVLGQVVMKQYTEFTNVFLFGQPKSASNHVHELLGRVLGLVDHPTGFTQINTYLYYPRVLATKFLQKNTISRSHQKNTSAITRMLRNLDLRPVVLTRNLLDALASRHEHIEGTDVDQDIMGEKQWRRYLRGNEEYQLDYTIQMYANMQIEFFTSWDAFSGDACFITWDDLVNDAVGMVDHVAEWLGLPVLEDVGKITDYIKAKGGSNLNKGIPGRGRKKFNDRQIAEIRRRADILGCDDEEFLGGVI
jgi:hypothetical protein